MEKPPSMEELRRQIAASKAAIAASEEAGKAADAEARKWREEGDKWRAKTESLLAQITEGLAQTGERLDKITESLDKLNKADGNEGNNRGFLFEREVLTTLATEKMLCGYRLDDVVYNLGGGQNYQYDLLGVNGEFAFVMELKIKLSFDDVVFFAEKRLPYAKAAMPTFARGKKPMGVMIYKQTDPQRKAVTEALKRDLLVFCADNAKNLTPIKTPDDVREPNHPYQK